MPVWYSYRVNAQSWDWISALKAIEVGKLIKPENRESFLLIENEDFIQVARAEDLGKLYGDTLSSVKQIAETPHI